jgi:nucleotide-binding universal stress UspA family protein
MTRRVPTSLVIWLTMISTLTSSPLVTGGADVANTILSYAADVSTDFVVMGGYGHSRLRAFILGGATRGVLSSMTIPALMSH